MVVAFLGLWGVGWGFVTSTFPAWLPGFLLELFFFAGFGVCAVSFYGGAAWVLFSFLGVLLFLVVSLGCFLLPRFVGLGVYPMGVCVGRFRAAFWCFVQFLVLFIHTYIYIYIYIYIFAIKKKIKKNKAIGQN